MARFKMSIRLRFILLILLVFAGMSMIQLKKNNVSLESSIKEQGIFYLDDIVFPRASRVIQFNNNSGPDLRIVHNNFPNSHHGYSQMLGYPAVLQGISYTRGKDTLRISLARSSVRERRQYNQIQFYQIPIMLGSLGVIEFSEEKEFAKNFELSINR